MIYLSVPLGDLFNINHSKMRIEMFHRNTDRDWEKFGASDPYLGVLTHEQYHRANLTDESKEAFFKSGHDYIADVSKKIRTYLDPAFTPCRSLDFGCGVGRLVVPLAGISDHVVGGWTCPNPC
jgi:2-polyprenyl-3-methyl-5-hydroxy-6-metoxy-1,4-benzoquinol methylase